MISQAAIEKLEKEAFRGPFLTLAALLLIIAGLAIIGLAFYFWLDLSEIAYDAFSSPGEPSVQQESALSSRVQWLELLPYQGLALILVGLGLLLWRWVAAVRLRMTVSALILPSLRSKEDLDPTESDTSAFEAPLEPDREAES